MGECWNCGATADDDWSCQACRTERGLAQDLADAGREIERLRAAGSALYVLLDEMHRCGRRQPGLTEALDGWDAATKEDDRGR